LHHGQWAGDLPPLEKLIGDKFDLEGLLKSPGYAHALNARKPVKNPYYADEVPPYVPPPRDPEAQPAEPAQVPSAMQPFDGSVAQVRREVTRAGAFFPDRDTHTADEVTAAMGIISRW